MASEEMSWQDKAAKKKAAQKASIPEAWRLPKSILEGISSTASVLRLPAESDLLSSEELDMTSNYDLVDLSQKLQARTFSALTVTTAFCKRAAIAHQAVRSFDVVLDWN